MKVLLIEDDEDSAGVLPNIDMDGIAFFQRRFARGPDRETVWLRHTALDDFGFDLSSLKVEPNTFPIDDPF